MDYQDKMIQGIYDGQHMEGEDGKRYPVPPNYASKSKLVVGDRLKLVISKDSSFTYKQIESIPRKRVIGIVTDNNSVIVDGKEYKILIQSLTYFKAHAGDEASILIPSNLDSEWAALENIIKDYD